MLSVLLFVYIFTQTLYQGQDVMQVHSLSRVHAFVHKIEKCLIEWKKNNVVSVKSKVHEAKLFLDIFLMQVSLENKKNFGKQTRLWPIYKNLKGGPGSNGNKDILHIPKSFKTRTSLPHAVWCNIHDTTFGGGLAPLQRVHLMYTFFFFFFKENPQNLVKLRWTKTCILASLQILK